MKLRTILLILGLLAFFSVTTGGFLYYSSLRTSVLHNSETQAAYHAEKIKNLISSYIVDNQKAARVLAGLKELQKALVKPNEIALTEANLILDHFNDSLKVSVSYLMDRNGKTIASSNRHDPDSFVGKNYSFRPYFKEAIHGNPSVYMALGVTSKKRGIYYSHPIYGSNQDSPIGIVVLKAGVDTIEEEFISLKHGPEATTFITGPHGIVFMSDHKKLLYRLLWQVADENLVELSNSKQFGKGPWKWSGFKQKSENRIVDKAGNEYLMFQRTIEFLSGWNVVHLLNMRELSKVITTPFIGTIGYIILSLCVLVCLSVFILYNMGKSDIIRRSKAEEALRESEELLRATIESTADGILVVDDKGQVTNTNKRFAQIWQIPDELIREREDKKLLDFVLDQLKDPEAFLTKVQILYKTLDEDFDVLHFKDGRVFERYSSPLVREGHIAGRVWSFRDVTERKQAGESLRESESRYRSLFESANDAILIIKDDEFMDCNRKALEMFGCTREQIIGKPPYTFSPIDQPDGSVSQEKALEIIKAAYKGEPQIFEWSHTKYDGTLFDAQVGLNLVELSTGIHLQAMVRDITEKKSLDKQIRLMQHWVEQSVDLFFWVREDSQILYVNQAVCYFLDYTKEEFRTMKVSDFDLDITLEVWPDFTRKLRERGSHRFESRLRKKNGQVFPVEITANILKFEGKDHFFAYGRDISAKVSAEKKHKEMENQLHQAHKMEAIGTLAGGIAHDFNNILGIILGNTELSMYDVPEWNPARLNLEEIRTASLRAKDVVRQLLSFARKTKLEKKPTNIIPIIKESLNLLRSSIPTSIEIRQNIPKDIDTIFADPTQINQVLINICTNADHAMPDGGIIEVSLKNVELDEDTAAKYPELNPGRYVNLVINDTGHGIAQDDIDRIFDPYFTTKEVDRGTGMGLAVVHGIVKGHNGFITVDSELGKGTTFRIFFPVVAKEAVVETETDEKLPTGDERILFVDDEELIVGIGHQILERLGYKVESTTSPIDALELFRSKPDQFDLVITDLTMPKMTGDKLVKEILKIQPDIPIILCTGFSEKIDEKKAKAIGVADYIEKPLDMRDYAMKIRKVLDVE